MFLNFKLVTQLGIKKILLIALSLPTQKMKKKKEKKEKKKKRIPTFFKKDCRGVNCSQQMAVIQNQCGG